MTTDKIGNFLGKAKDSLTTMGNTITTKSKEIADITNLSARKAQLERENKENYLALGRLVAESGVIDEQAKELIGKIEVKKMDIEILEQQIEEAKDKDK